jgi:hypothetical protein
MASLGELTEAYLALPAPTKACLYLRGHSLAQLMPTPKLPAAVPLKSKDEILNMDANAQYHEYCLSVKSVLWRYSSQGHLFRNDQQLRVSLSSDSRCWQNDVSSAFSSACGIECTHDLYFALSYVLILSNSKY